MPPEFAIEVSKNKNVTLGELGSDPANDGHEYVVNDTMFPSEVSMDYDTDIFKVDMLPWSVTHKLPIQISLFDGLESGRLKLQEMAPRCVSSLSLHILK